MPARTGTTPSKPLTPGVNWKPDRQRLYRFTRNSITVIQPWPSAMCWEKIQSWQGAPTKMRLDLLELGTSAPYPYRFEVDAWSSIPERVRARVLKASCVGRQWNSLRFLARCPAAHSLFDEQPFLAAAAANLRSLRRWQERSAPKKPWRDLRRALNVPRSRDRWARVARLLGWPQERSFFRMLRRAGSLAPETWPLADLSKLGYVWTVPWLRKVLQHGPALTSGRLAALVAALELVEIGGRLPARLFLELPDDHAAENLAGAIRSLAFTALDHAPVHRPAFAHLASLEAIEEATAQLSERVHVDLPFPPPPLTGEPGIVPLDTAQKLVEEGRAMDHCIGGGGFSRRAQTWQGYGYSIRDPVTDHRSATVWIVPSQHTVGAFSIEQIQGPGNHPIPMTLRQRVEQWLSLAALPPGRPSTAAPLQPTQPSLHPDWMPESEADALSWRSALRRKTAFGDPHQCPAYLGAGGHLLAHNPFEGDEIPF